MFCINCGKEIGGTEKFCPHCGTSRQAMAPKEPAKNMRGVSAGWVPEMWVLFHTESNAVSGKLFGS